jgi:hypothetical protein
MNLRLVASNDAVRLRFETTFFCWFVKAVSLVQRGLVRLVTWEQAPWVVHHWTPFNDLQPGEASSPGYRHAVERPHAMPDLPEGLEAWHGVKVLRVLWADDGGFEVASFVRGPREDLALAL